MSAVADVLQNADVTTLLIAVVTLLVLQIAKGSIPALGGGVSQKNTKILERMQRRQLAIMRKLDVEDPDGY